MAQLDDREILELRQLCTSGGLSQDSLAALIDANLAVPTLVKSEAAAMASAKRAGLGLAERNKLREALRKHKDNVLSAVEPAIVEIGDDAEAHHIVAAQHHMMELRKKKVACAAGGGGKGHGGGLEWQHLRRLPLDAGDARGDPGRRATAWYRQARRRLQDHAWGVRARSISTIYTEPLSLSPSLITAVSRHVCASMPCARAQRPCVSADARVRLARPASHPRGRHVRQGQGGRLHVAAAGLASADRHAAEADHR